LYNIEKIYICGNEGMRHKTRKWEKKVKLEKENERDSEMREKDKGERIWRMKDIEKDRERERESEREKER